MRQRFNLMGRVGRWIPASAVLLLLLISPASVWSQTFSPTAGQAAVSSDSLRPAVSSLLDEGTSLEAAGRWGEALSHYEEALRAHPDDPVLMDRFDVARLHYSLDQRYNDTSFRKAVTTMGSRDAIDLYDDLLDKIDTNYVSNPPWRELCLRSGRAMDVALSNEEFLTVNGIHAQPEQLDQLRRDLARVTRQSRVRSHRDLTAVANEAARLSSYRIGLNRSATIMEFTAAAAGGLDHYSSFLTSDQLHDVYSQIEGNFVGLGVELKADEGALLIVDVIPGSPAKKAGIAANDRIVAIDGKSLRNMSTDEAASLLTGREGSVVRVTLDSPGKARRELSIRRANVEVPSLTDVKILEPESGVAYIRIPAFQKTTSRDLESALWDLHRQGMRSLILDLRGNPGGLLTASVEVADKFVAQGSIVSTHGRNPQEDFNYQAHRAGTWRVPLVVLIDGDSASASEIFAGAIRDSERGVIIGEKSYGKGSVQGIFPLSRGGAGIRLTTAKFFSPNGHPISGVGVNPHVDVRLATPVAEGADRSSAGPHLVGYRGTQAAESDTALRLAVERARTMQPAVL